jgi:N-formylglutamate amidohydrolase
VVFNSPHSGRSYPESFIAASRLDRMSLRRSEDCYVDEWLDGVARFGCPLVKANFPRAYLDVNREAYELDPLMFAEPLPGYVNTTSPRVAGGLGTIPRIVSETEEIYRHPLTFAEADARIRSLYVPYHRALDRLLDDARGRFGAALLIDCHSMPSTAAGSSVGEATFRPDVVLGDRHGASCWPALTEFVETLLEARGYRVARNKPYAGGYITQAYGHPAAGFHALQLEVNRALYVDEAVLAKHAGFERLREDVAQLAGALVERLPGLLRPLRIAAE